MLKGSASTVKDVNLFLFVYRIGVVSDPPLQESDTDPQSLLDALNETEQEVVSSDETTVEVCC